MGPIETVRLKRYRPRPDPPPRAARRRSRPRWGVFPLFLIAVLVGTVLWGTGWTPARVRRAADDRRNLLLARLEVHNVSEQVRLHHLAEERYPVDFRHFLTVALRPRAGHAAWEDPWGTEYVLTELPQWEFEVRCAGPDRRHYTRDDLVRRGSVLPPEPR